MSNEAPTPDGNPLIYDKAIETAEIEAARAVEEEKGKTAEEMLDDLLPLVLRSRDFEILHWLVHTLGRTKLEVVKRMLTEAIVKERRAYREAQGQGGKTTTDLSGYLGRT